MLLAVDPGSKAMGLALLTLEGEVIMTALLSSSKPTWGARLAEMNAQFAKLKFKQKMVTEVACEHVKGSSNAPLLNCISGIIWYQLPQINLKQTTFIVPPTWKAYVRKTTGEKDPKGVDSLKKLCYGVDGILSDDEADAVMIGLCYLNKTRG